VKRPARLSAKAQRLKRKFKVHLFVFVALARGQSFLFDAHVADVEQARTELRM